MNLTVTRAEVEVACRVLPVAAGMLLFYSVNAAINEEHYSCVRCDDIHGECVICG